MKTIYLIRHGEIDAGRPRTFIGRTDLPLTSRGREQLHRLEQHLASISFDHITCSPLERCQQSGEILGAPSNTSVISEPQLAEIDLGAWEGLTAAEIQKKFPGEYEARGENMAVYTPPGGESFNDLLARTWPVLLKIIETTISQTAVVSHAGVNRVLLCKILGMPLANMFSLKQDYGCYNVLHVKENRLILGCLNVSAD